VNHVIPNTSEEVRYQDRSVPVVRCFYSIMKPVKVGANFIIRSEISGGSCRREHLSEGFIHCITGLTDTHGKKRLLF
jgi:hypothetical protein